MNDPDQHGHFLIAPADSRLESLAEFAAGAGHEINNPLANILGRSSLLLKGELDPDRRQSLAIIAAQALRVRDMIGDLMLFARPPVPILADHNLRLLCEEIVARLRNGFARDAAPIHLAIEDGQIPCDKTQFSVLLSALIQNSVEASLDRESPIRVVASRAENRWKIRVIDHGKPWSEIERIHAFDPFFSGRQAGRGLGFGLCKAWRIAQAHLANLWIETLPNGNTTINLDWPVSSA